MNLDLHNIYLAQAQKLTAENPELHAEMRRRQQAGEWFQDDEPVTAYWRELNRLNKVALTAVDC